MRPEVSCYCKCARDRRGRATQLAEGSSHLLLLVDAAFPYPSVLHTPSVLPVLADYMLNYLGIPAEQVAVLTQQLYYQYGTTMAGLAAKGYQLDFDHYHAHVHGTLDYQGLLSAQPATRKTLADMTIQKHILTNADAKHTAACLERMGLTDCFQVRCSSCLSLAAFSRCNCTIASQGVCAIGKREHIYLHLQHKVLISLMSSTLCPTQLGCNQRCPCLMLYMF